MNANGQQNKITYVQNATNIKEIRPTDDTYVYGMNGKSKDVIRGIDDPDVLISYFYRPVYNFDIYLKFDLSWVIRNPERIENVKLRMYGADAYGSVHTLELFEQSGTDWDEENLTYATLGNTGTRTKIASMTSNMGTSQWYDWDITDFVKTCKANNKNVICLRVCDSIQMKEKDGKTSVYATLHSKENPSGNAPHLKVVENSHEELLLDHVTVDGILLQDFNPIKFEYNILLPASTTQIPMVVATPIDSTAVVSYNHATSLSGAYEERSTFIHVAVGAEVQHYVFTFERVALNNDAQVTNITVDDFDLEFFDKTTLNYIYYLPYTHASDVIPTVGYFASNPNQQIVVIPATNLNGSLAEKTTHVHVKAGDLSFEQEYTITFEVLPKLDLYFCIGQSNMAGRGYMNEALGDFESIDNVFLLTPNLGWEIATNPMNKYSSTRKEMSMQRISPAYGFAINIKDKVSGPIGMVVNAKGASTIAHWTKGNAEGLYSAAILRAKEAQKWGQYKAILWHQGEGDSGSRVVTYPTNLKALVDDLRLDLNEPDLYFVAGELAYWRGGGSGSTAFNEMIRTISSFVPNSDYISADGATPLSDSSDPHFDREGNILLGKRYAEKVLEKIYGIASANPSLLVNKLKITVESKSISIFNCLPHTIIKIYDITGRLAVNKVTNDSMEHEFEVPGIYILVINNNTGFSSTQLLQIKN